MAGAREPLRTPQREIGLPVATDRRPAWLPAWLVLWGNIGTYFFRKCAGKLAALDKGLAIIQAQR